MALAQGVGGALRVAPSEGEAGEREGEREASGEKEGEGVVECERLRAAEGEAPVAGDPAAFVPPSLYGEYAVSWSGNASIIVGPGTEAALSGASFDAATWRGAARVTLTPSGGALIPGLVLGFFDKHLKP